ncbi:MAG TPA: M23 family metallopeptidase [Gemmatimonadales bacterium]|jgi:murein DD-endopeptidase MepM/ murein hydrolase activator NlpD
MRWRVAGGLLVVSATAVAMVGVRRPWVSAELPVARPIVVVGDLSTEVLDTLRRGETLSQLLARQGVLDFDVSRLDVAALDPRRLRAGLVFSFRRPAADSLPDRISVRASPEQRVVFRRAVTGWESVVDSIRWRSEPFRIDGDIVNSLYEAIDAQVGDDQLDAAQRQRLAWDLADIYAWQVDFTRDIQNGDKFRVVFDRLISEDGEVRFGRVLASDLTMSGKSLTAFRFESGAHSTFYDEGGKSLRRAFLRAPVQFRRISSSFARARRHPVLGITRRHQGTDYAASPGTPVMAAGDGVVLRAGWAGGYGNLIELRHRNGISTRYGHLRGFARGIRSGARVSQGQIIGYVGSTGLASGPHLHYEFRVNGVAKDSRRVALGNGAPVPDAEREAFELERDRLKTMLDGPPSGAIASAATDTGERPLP